MGSERGVIGESLEVARQVSFLNVFFKMCYKMLTFVKGTLFSGSFWPRFVTHGVLIFHRCSMPLLIGVGQPLRTRGLTSCLA